MKHSFLWSGGLALTVLISSCGNTTELDSKKAAEKANDAKIDSAKAADTGDSTTNAMAAVRQDADFAVAAADGGLLEVQLGKMAMTKAVDAGTRALGAMMVKDHSAANAELMAAAKTNNITLPAVLSEKCQKMVTDLTDKKGTDFDKAYADLMVSDHKEDIDEFKKEAEKGKDADLSAWAKSKIPTLEHHLMMAEQAKKIADKFK